MSSTPSSIQAPSPSILSIFANFPSRNQSPDVGSGNHSNAGSAGSAAWLSPAPSPNFGLTGRRLSDGTVITNNIPTLTLTPSPRMGPATSSGDSHELRSITLGFETGSGTPGNSGTTTVEQKVTFYHWGQGKPDKEMYYKLLEKYNASRDAVGLCQCEHTYATCTHGPVDPGKIPGEPSIPIQQWQPLRQCNNTVSATDLIPPSRLCQSCQTRQHPCV